MPFISTPSHRPLDGLDIQGGPRGPFVPSPSDLHPDPVGIIGAGVGGLYAAIMLKSLDIPYQILEGSDRIGGRILTHKFGEKQCETCSGYDYFVSTAITLIPQLS